MLQPPMLHLQRHILWTVFFLAIAIGLISAFSLFAMDKYSLLYFGDATSHSFGARKIVDWAEPGLQQLGTVWLPLPHLLLLPFTLIDPLFTTGFAGMIVSLPSFAVTSVLIYKMVKRNMSTTLTLLPLCAALLYITNPNILYLGITAMTEAPFMLFFVASAFYFQKWLDNPSRLRGHLVYSAVFIVLASLSRYEAWILPLFLIPVTIVIAARNREVENKTRVLLILSSLISVSGILFWLGYNAIIYGDALEFANADYYSAASQAANRSIRETLFLQPTAVLSVYSVTAIAVYGPVLVAAGAGVNIWMKERRSSAKRITDQSTNNDHVRSDQTRSQLLYTFLALPPLFTLITLFVGIGEMTFWFNSRFLVLLAPVLILLSSISIDRIWRKYGSIYSGKNEDQATKPVSSLIPSLVIASLFIYFLAVSVFGGVVTFLDAKNGFDFPPNPYSVQTAEALKSIYDGEGKIMVLTGSAQEHRILTFSGIPLAQFDEIIESNTWKESYQEPWKYNRWIVISKSPDSDGVTSTRYWAEERRSELDSHYAKVYENAFYEILVLKAAQ